MVRAVEISWYERARFLHQREEYADVRALYENMCLGSAAQCEPLGRSLWPYGFEVLSDCKIGLGESVHRFGQDILAMLNGCLADVVNRQLIAGSCCTVQLR